MPFCSSTSWLLKSEFWIQGPNSRDSTCQV
jgi:hypothetical protein